MTTFLRRLSICAETSRSEVQVLPKALKEKSTHGAGMKHCPNCGHKLPISDVKYCPGCGKSLSGSAAKEYRAEGLPNLNFKIDSKKAISSLVALTLVLVFLYLIFGRSSEQQSTVLQTYDQYRGVYRGDIEESENIRNAYNMLTFSTFTQKAEKAQEYGLKAQQAIAHFDDFKAFIKQNQPELQRAGLNVPVLLAEIESNRAVLLSNSKLMAQQLEQYAKADAAKLSLIGNILKLLVGLG